MKLRIKYGFYFLGCFILITLAVHGSPSPFGDFYDTRGNKIGTDGKNDGKKFIVTGRADIRRIKKVTKNESSIHERDVPSSVILPSDAAIRESLNLLQRIQSRGGLKEESSIVMKNESVIRGSVGPEPTIAGNVETVGCILPALPDSSTRDDVETTIHPHPTAVEIRYGRLFMHSANKPSSIDRSTFVYFTTNIIVGPLDEAGHLISSFYGAPSIPARRMGLAIFYHNGAKPSVTITKTAAERILKN